MTELSKYKQPFDPDWPHGHLMQGNPARVICSDLRGDYPYAIAFECDLGEEETLLRVDSDGYSYRIHRVINAPAPKRTWWVNVYIDGKGKPIIHSHSTKERADNWAGKHRIACIKVTEGEGLKDD